LFRVGADGTFTKLHDFSNVDGYEPLELVVGPDGALYGATYVGGAHGSGTLFRLRTDGTFATLHDFDGTDGAAPQSSLVVGSDGAMYGSTLGGTLFRLTTDGNFTNLHDFTDDVDGSNPSGLVAGSDGALYGSTYSGGANNRGTLFQLKTDGSFRTLHQFDRTSFMSTPLAAGPDGAIYGCTLAGRRRTLFRLDTNGTFTELLEFGGAQGAGPLVLGPNRRMYGSALSGGTRGGGVLFKLVLEPSSPDTDGDGVPDDVDSCLATTPDQVVDAQGCGIDQLVPCSGPRAGGAWRNHGQYVSDVTKAASEFARLGLISGTQKGATVRSAARSQCGR
jgi:uncharacterized repeat protein (TIGR03803 family)